MASVEACFAQYGAKKFNPVWSWSARNSDDSKVVVTFWADRLNYKTTPVSYAELPPGNPWEKSPGNAERRENLRWARDNLNGILHAVIVRAVDPTARDREVADAHINEKLLMRLVTLDEETGHFTAEAVLTTPAARPAR